MRPDHPRSNNNRETALVAPQAQPITRTADDSLALEPSLSV
jgi:hypothetical protein